MVPRSLSFVDIAKVPGGTQVMQRNNKEEIDNLLVQLGFDIKLGWELVECHHRPLTSNRAVYGFRIEGYESCSDEWIKSGNASLEARLEAVQDKSLRDELIGMCKTGTADKTFQNDETAKSVLKNQKKI